MPERSSAAATSGGASPSQTKPESVTTSGSSVESLAQGQLPVPSAMVEVRRPWGLQATPRQPLMPGTSTSLVADQKSGSEMLNAWLVQDAAEDPFHAIAALAVGTGTATISKSTAVVQAIDSLFVNRAEQEGTVATCGSWTEEDR
uniref:Uncharacterized protein n=1 Tax=Bionectria ochroleuca TaxID=29856 RepID=A0A8H7KAE1_BIOOC